MANNIIKNNLLPCVRTTDRDYTLVTCRSILELTIN